MDRAKPQKLALPAASNNDDEEKKIVRKEVERQRRQQMSSLVASLRSLIPLKLIKGKRSMSDLIIEAVNHINELKNNIQELNAQMEELQRSANCCELGGSSSGSSSVSCVRVRHYFDGIEIVITIHRTGQEGFLLSRLLQGVMEEGLDVVNCVSTMKDEGFCVSTIQCQANGFSYNDAEDLQQKLNNMILSTR